MATNTSEHQKMTLWLFNSLKPSPATDDIAESKAKIIFDLTKYVPTYKGETWSCSCETPRLEEPILYVNGKFKKVMRRPDLMFRIRLHFWREHRVVAIYLLDCIIEVKPKLDEYNNLQKAIGQLNEASLFYIPKTPPYETGSIPIRGRSTCLVICTNDAKYDTVLRSQGIVVIHPIDYQN